MIEQRETWVTFLVTKLKHHLLWHPHAIFTAEVFVETVLAPSLIPKDKRWIGIAFQRAKREGVISEMCVPDGGVVTQLTRAGHRTVVWGAA